MKAVKVAGLLALVLGFSVLLSARTLKLVDIDKGETADAGSGTEVSLSELHPFKEGGMSMLFSFPGHGYIGQYKPKKAAWAGYKKVKFITFNEGKEKIESVQFFLRGSTMKDTPDNSKTWKLVIPSGKYEFEFPITGQICDDGKTPLDMNTAFQWQFENAEKTESKFFVLKIWLED